MGTATIDKLSWQHLILTVSDQLLELQGLFQQLHACMSVMMWWYTQPVKLTVFHAQARSMIIKQLKVVTKKHALCVEVNANNSRGLKVHIIKNTTINCI